MYIHNWRTELPETPEAGAISDYRVLLERPTITDGGKGPFERSRYEWDETKRTTNVEKHRIDFLDAIEAFTDPQGYVYRSPRSQSEPRLVAVGLVKGSLSGVIFTERGDRVRIISARAARRSERRQYG